MINLDSKVRRNAQVVARELAPGEGGVLLHLETAQYYGVNPVGLVIWELLDGEPTVQEVVEGVRTRIPSAPPQLEDDVIGFLSRISDRDLIVLE